MPSIIRSISVGPDPLNGMRFSVGQPMNIWNKDKTKKRPHTVSEIRESISNQFDVFIENPDVESYIWKSYRNMPVSLEYNTTFEDENG